MTTDIIIREVPAYGFLPLVTFDGREVFRGSFHPTPEDALASALEMLPEIRQNEGV